MGGPLSLAEDCNKFLFSVDYGEQEGDRCDLPSSEGTSAEGRSINLLDVYIIIYRTTKYVYKRNGDQ